MWKRDVPVPYMDPTQYCPKNIRNEVVWGYLSDNIADSKRSFHKIKQLMKQKPAFLCSMLVYLIHQCCGKDKLSLCEKVLDLIQDTSLRSTVVNSSFGKKGYTPLHRCAYNGSERMIKLLISSGANINVVSPENETLVQVLEEGLRSESKLAEYTKATIINVDPKTNFYKVRMPSGEIQSFSSTLVDHTRKYVKAGEVYVLTPDTKKNIIFIQERFDFCRLYIQREQSNALFVSKIRFRKPRSMGKRMAARRIQTWWRDRHKAP